MSGSDYWDAVRRETLYLPEGAVICQLVFLQVQGPVLRPYGHPELGSHYQHQMGTTPSYLEES